MKLLFNETLQDKYTGAYYYKGTTHDFPEERANEIFNSGRKVVLIPEETPTPETPEDTEGAELVQVDLEKLSINDLRACAKDLGVSAKGSKQEIIERINALK